MLPGSLFEKQIQRFTPAVKSIPVVCLVQKFKFTHVLRL